MDENVIEKWASIEYQPGVSAGAAARQLCRWLGASGAAPTLKRMLEEMLGDANQQSWDRSFILAAFDAAAPEAAKQARRESFARNNRHIAAQGDAND